MGPSRDGTIDLINAVTDPLWERMAGHGEHPDALAAHAEYIAINSAVKRLHRRILRGRATADRDARVIGCTAIAAKAALVFKVR